MHSSACLQQATPVGNRAINEVKLKVSVFPATRPAPIRSASPCWSSSCLVCLLQLGQRFKVHVNCIRDNVAPDLSSCSVSHISATAVCRHVRMLKT
jgi:hypothetical protein